MLHAQRMAVVASQARQQQEQSHGKNNNSDDSTILDYRHAFYLATLGGAVALGLQDRIGTLRVGMEFDALVLSAANDVAGPVTVFDTDTTVDIFQKLCVLGDDRNVTRVFVQGRQVKPEQSQ